MTDNFTFNEKPNDNNEDNCGDFIDHHRANLFSDASHGSDSFSNSEHPKVSS
jgi:hypothetical protein